MSEKAVREALEKFDKAKDIIRFKDTLEIPVYTALGISPSHMGRARLFFHFGGVSLVVLPYDREIDGKKFRACFGEKPRILPPEFVEMTVGYLPDELSPFGMGEDISVYLDSSMRWLRKIYLPAGSARCVVPMTPKELKICSGAVDWIDVCTKKGYL